MSYLKRAYNFEDDHSPSSKILLLDRSNLNINSPLALPSNSNCPMEYNHTETYKELEAQLNQQYFSVSCNFTPRPGHIYHLYERRVNERYFGMLSPEEWTKAPHPFLGSFLFGDDHKWTAVAS